VSNKWGTLTFKFVLEVFNHPPFFSEPLEDRLINLGYSGFFRLPQPLGPEDSPIMLYASGKKKEPLPQFIKFDSRSRTFYVSTNSYTELGSYLIEVDVVDYYGAFTNRSFTIQVANLNQTKQGTSKKYESKLYVSYIKRDGVALVKISSQAPRGVG
jgi:hypothetical protein